MGGKIDWMGNQFAQQMRAEMRRRTSAASIRLANRIRAEISQPGTLRYSTGKSKQRTVYNFTHSRPGNPPYKQTGQLRRSIAWELVTVGLGATVVGRVGTNLKYGRYLELGTGRMARRPYIVGTLRKHEGEIRSILLAQIGPGGLQSIVSNQFRSGHFGSGARGAGYF